MDHRYDGELANRIEAHWQAHWAEQHTFDAEPRADRPKHYVLDMFAGPSGALHVGHPLGYVATDVHGRYRRMRGDNVMHAFGFDAFGLPAEQYAIRTGRPPKETTDETIATIRRQLNRLGLAHDPRRGVATTDPAYYRWTQWIFLQIFDAWYDERRGSARPIAELTDEFESGIRPTPDGRPWADLDAASRRAVVDEYRLAYVADAPVNWCPGLGTVLANEEVTAEGRSERGNFPVFPRRMRQWMLPITAYADRLLAGLDELDWPESIKSQQRNWIPGMRDWLFSRQRYWGEPFPIVYDEHGPIALPESMLPVELPDLPAGMDYAPPAYDPEDADSMPEAPLGRLPGWATVTLDPGDGPREYRRETNTMPQWAGSCWYELRYLDPDNDTTLCDPTLERYWMGPSSTSDCGGVDLYVGGVEHAVLHLLYARFWHHVLHDLGHVASREPYRRLVTVGYIRAYAYRDARGINVPAAEVDERGGEYYWRGQPVTRTLSKMGKSLRNMVTPDEMCDRYGADSLRVYEMSMGPLRESRPWVPDGIVGAHRFLRRVWRNVIDEVTGEVTVVESPAEHTTRRLLHRTIAAVRGDLDELAFNTAIARLIELNNQLTGLPAVPREVAEPLVLMLAPFAPHVAEELWHRLGHPDSLAYATYPVADPELAAAEAVTCVISVQGKPRDRLEVAPSIGADELRERALASPTVRAAVAGREVDRVIVRAPRVVNVVLASRSIDAATDAADTAG